MSLFDYRDFLNALNSPSGGVPVPPLALLLGDAPASPLQLSTGDILLLGE